MQSYQISFDTYRTILATFQSVFPETTVFIVPNGSDTILVGSRQPLRLDPSLRRDDGELAAEASRIGNGRQFLVGEDVGEIEAALAMQSLRIDRQPAARLEIEDIVVVNVAVEDTIRFGWNAGKVMLFDAKTGMNIGRKAA